MKLVQHDGKWIEKGQHVTGHHGKGDVTGRDLPPTPPTLEQRIYHFVWESSGGVSRREIAKALGLKSTDWLNGKIEGLVTGGYLRRATYYYRPNMPTYKYEIAT